MRKPNSRLSSEAVAHLRELEKQGILNTKAAAQTYGVATETIRRAVRGDTWIVREVAAVPSAESSLEKLQLAIAKTRQVQVVATEILTEGEGESEAKKRGYLE
jgi:hypothetical protein